MDEQAAEEFKERLDKLGISVSEYKRVILELCVQGFTLHHDIYSPPYDCWLIVDVGCPLNDDMVFYVDRQRVELGRLRDVLDGDDWEGIKYMKRATVEEIMDQDMLDDDVPF